MYEDDMTITFISISCLNYQGLVTLIFDLEIVSSDIYMYTITIRAGYFQVWCKCSLPFQLWHICCQKIIQCRHLKNWSASYTTICATFLSILTFYSFSLKLVARMGQMYVSSHNHRSSAMEPPTGTATW